MTTECQEAVTIANRMLQSFFGDSAGDFRAVLEGLHKGAEVQGNHKTHVLACGAFIAWIRAHRPKLFSRMVTSAARNPEHAAAVTLSLMIANASGMPHPMDHPELYVKPEELPMLG